MNRYIPFILVLGYMVLSVQSSWASGEKRYLSKETWDRTLDKIEQIYSQVLAPKGLGFKVDKYWDYDEANATVGRDDTSWKIIMLAGYTLHPEVTSDVIALVACHEMGHHLGGTAFYKEGLTWATVEGQADYYATLKCMRRYYEGSDSRKELRGQTVPEVVRQKCSQAWESGDEKFQCMRSAVAALKLMKIHFEEDQKSNLQKREFKLSFSTPSRETVTKTVVSYPSDQCRLDTLFQGALCTVDHRIETDDRDPSQGTCSEKTGLLGTRPNCWYAGSRE
ncbi:MAG TPA: hypothetical protein VNJ01_12570 [Bacteriovoracaceae bacterium]|nr:hypothetical protein [Bacteriovoracaceae bacterium]